MEEKEYNFLEGGNWGLGVRRDFGRGFKGYPFRSILEVIDDTPFDMDGLPERWSAIVMGKTSGISKAERLVMKLPF